MNSADVGRQGELAAAHYLEARGWRLLAHGFRVRGGELDLVAEKDGLVAFIEVKTRRQGAMDDGRGAVHRAKQRRLLRAAGLFLARSGLGDRPCRFDVILVCRHDKGMTVEHLPAAFQEG